MKFFIHEKNNQKPQRGQITCTQIAGATLKNKTADLYNMSSGTVWKILKKKELYDKLH